MRLWQLCSRPQITVAQALLCFVNYYLGNRNHSKTWIAMASSLYMYSHWFYIRYAILHGPRSWNFSKIQKVMKFIALTIYSNLDLFMRRCIYWGICISNKLVCHFNWCIILYVELLTFTWKDLACCMKKMGLWIWSLCKIRFEWDTYC